MTKVVVDFPDFILERLEKYVEDRQFSDLNEAITTAVIHMVVHADRYGLNSIKKKVKWAIEEHNKAVKVHEESIRLNREALERYRKAGVRQYKWLSANDERTCNECKKLHGKIFDVNDENAPLPPLHFGCRCTIIPVIDLKSR